MFTDLPGVYNSRSEPNCWVTYWGTSPPNSKQFAIDNYGVVRHTTNLLKHSVIEALPNKHWGLMKDGDLKKIAHQATYANGDQLNCRG